MPGTLTFVVDDRLKAIVAHARNAPGRKPTYADLYDPDMRIDGKAPAEDAFPRSEEIDESRIPHGLWLVKDRGVYIMSPGTPHLPSPGDPESSLVAYALEADPADEGCYDTARSIMGGDDGCDRIDLDFFEGAITLGMSTVLIGVDENSLSLAARA